MTRLASILAALSLAIGAQGASVTLTSSGGQDAILCRLSGDTNAWAQKFGGPGTDLAQCVLTDGSGNSYVAGTFMGTVSFGGFTLTNAGGYDVFLLKVNSSGVVQWATRYGGAAGSETVKSLAIDPSGNLYVSGNLITGALAKFNSSGVFQWVAGPPTANFTSIASDSSGNIAVTGDFKAAYPGIDFGNGHVIYCPYGTVNAFLARYSSAGACLMAVDFNNFGDNQFGTSIAIDASNNIFAAGYAFTGLDLGGGFMTNNSPGAAFGFMGKFNSSGTFIWGRRCGTTTIGDLGPFARTRSIGLDHNGDVLMGGEFEFHTNLGGEPMDSGNHIITGSSSVYDIFLVKYAGSTGSYQWSRVLPFNASGSGTPKLISADSSNNFFLAGSFYGTCNFGSQSLTAPGGTFNSDGFVAKYTSAGSPISAQQFNSVGASATGVSVDPSDAPVVSGAFSGTATIFLYATTTYYVATTGNDSNDGSAGSPWLTIGKAVGTVIGGDTVNVGAGTFNEFITNTISGTAINPIVFVGTRSGTNWLTIIDPSTPMTNGWVAAPEIGAGVYKHTGSFITRELTIGNQRLAAVYDMGDISASLNQAYASPGITTGTQVLALATSATFTNLHGHVVNFWDGVEAMWGTVSTNTYLRLRNGSDPNGLAIRVSPNHPSLWTTDMVRPAVNVNASYVTWRNFAVRNAFGQFYVQGSGNVIESNYLSAGYCRVRVFSGSGNTIQNNEATANYYGYATPGAWQFASGATNVIREQLYDVSKFLMGVDTSFDEGIDCLEAGANNLIAYNRVYGGIGTGVSAFSNLLSYSPTTNLVVCSNTISGHPSAGVLLSEGVASAKVFQNDIRDCNISVRFNHLDASLDSSRVAYVYRNRLWNPTNSGEAFYFHLSSGSAATFFPTLWIWNNSFSGGGGGLDISTFAATSGGLTNAHILNNIFSGSTYIVNQSTAIMTNAFVLKDFAYNEVTPPLVTFPSTNHPAWWGAGNVTANAAEWNTAAIPSFDLSPLSKAIDAALNVTAPFVLNGTSYAALPGPSPVMSGTAFDIGVVEMRFPPPVTHLKVAHLQWKH